MLAFSATSRTSPEIIRLAAMLYSRYLLSLRNVEDLLHRRGIHITHETVRFWWNRFGTIFAAELRRSRVQAKRNFRQRRWHLDEMFVKINRMKHRSGGELLSPTGGHRPERRHS